MVRSREWDKIVGRQGIGGHGLQASQDQDQRDQRQARGDRRWLPRLGSWLAVAVLALGLGGCGGGPRDRVELTLVSLNTMKAAYSQIIPAFAEQWRQEHSGQEVIVSQSYGPSGSQTRALIDGLDGDVVHLGLGLDVEKLEETGLIDPGWEAELPNQSVPTTSVVALIVRDGNPKQIEDWEDLIRPDVSILTPDPKTSGAARWTFLALWHAASDRGEAAAEAFVKQVYRNAPLLPRDAREATGIFYKQRRGDVLVNYENEAILAALNGEELPYLVPRRNVEIANPVAIVDRYVERHGNREVVEAFVRFLFTPEAQRAFAATGFRSIDPAIAATPALAATHPAVDNPATAADFGGWSAIQKKFFESGGTFDRIRQQLAANRDR